MTGNGGNEDKAMSKWRPIKTAPKNEYDEVLIRDPRAGVKVAFWYGKSDPDKWIGADEPANHVIYVPTHWMPLPEEPEKE